MRIDTRTLWLPLLTLLLLGRATNTHAQTPVKAFHEIAQPAPRPEGAPAYSDVCFSSRWKHPTNAEDAHDTFATAQAFGVTRYLWVYTVSAEFIHEAKQTANSFQCALNSMVADEHGGGRQQGRLTDVNGALVSAPWMRAWKDPAWGCCNSPEWRASYLAAAKSALDAGADLFQMDDPGLNYTAIKWGACFCPHCMDGFRGYLREHTTAEEHAAWGIADLDTFDYGAFLREQGAPAGDAFEKWDGGPLKEQFRAFLQESVGRFYRDLRAQIDAYAGRHVPFSSNNYGGQWHFPYDLFDFGLAELPHRNLGPALIYDRLKDARERGNAQVFTLVSEDVALTRRIIATAYACGGHLLVPWDVYLGPTPEGSRRYYGKPEDFADLYHFVRDHAELFDGYEDAVAAIPGTEDPRQAGHPALRLAGSDAASALLRARPGQPGAPIVVHLIDWSDTPGELVLQIDRARLSGAHPPRLQLLRPGQEAVNIPSHVADGQLTATLPPCVPWSIIVLYPAP